MVKAEVIQKVTEPRNWISSLVIVHRKNWSLRVCLDIKNMNKAIERPQYNLPIFKNITSKLVGAKYFNALNTFAAFCQVNRESLRFCNFFLSPSGWFKFKWIPYGLKCIPERFQSGVVGILESDKMPGIFFFTI